MQGKTISFMWGGVKWVIWRQRKVKGHEYITWPESDIITK